MDRFILSSVASGGFLTSDDFYVERGLESVSRKKRRLKVISVVVAFFSRFKKSKPKMDVNKESRGMLRPVSFSSCDSDSTRDSTCSLPSIGSPNLSIISNCGSTLSGHYDEDFPHKEKSISLQSLSSRCTTLFSYRPEVDPSLTISSRYGC